jgi:PAS domain S-box-containing protein
MEELATTLAELDVAEEELREQGEMLDETRSALVREQQQYQRLFEFAPDAYVVTDLHGSIQRANLTAVQLLNLEAKFLTHKPLVVFVADEQHHLFRDAVTNLGKSGRVTTFELRLHPRRYHSHISVITTMNLIHEPDGTPSAIHWAFIDITTQKRLEDELRQLNAQLEKRVAERTANLEEANQQKDELLAVAQGARAEAENANQLKLKLLATISHELRTPLASIKGFASTLLAKDVTGEQERWESFVTIIDEEASKLNELVEQILDVSRLQAGALSIHIEPSKLSSVVEQARQDLQPHLDEHQLIVELPPDLPPVLIDQRRITQVLVNLVGNAVKYSPNGTSIVLTASVQPDAVEMWVADEGVGIPKAEREQVFEAFYQSNGGLRKRAGTGIGLAI